MSSIETPPAHTRRALIAARLDHVRNWLNSTLEHVPADLVEWAPAEG